MIFSTVLLIIAFSFILIKSADHIVVALRRLGRQTHTGLFTLSALVLAISTSFPELFVGVTSALEGNPNLSLGDITGSNIANISLVVGVASLITGKVRVRGGFLRRDVLIALLAGVLPILLLADTRLSRVDGLILLSVYAAYATSFFKLRFTQIAEEQEQEDYIYRFLRKFNHVDSRERKEFGRLFVSIAVMLFAADVIVKLATLLASQLSIPSLVVGLIIVAIGTSLPELAFSLRSLEDHSPSMFFGNLLGSTVANSTLVIGIVSIIHPIEIVAVSNYTTAAVTFVAAFSTFWLFIKTKHRLDRWEGAVLLILYLVFVALEFMY